MGLCRGSSGDQRRFFSPANTCPSATSSVTFPERQQKHASLRPDAATFVSKQNAAVARRGGCGLASSSQTDGFPRGPTPAELRDVSVQLDWESTVNARTVLASVAHAAPRESCKSQLCCQSPTNDCL